MKKNAVFNCLSFEPFFIFSGLLLSVALHFPDDRLKSPIETTTDPCFRRIFVNVFTEMLNILWLMKRLKLSESPCRWKHLNTFPSLVYFTVRKNWWTVGVSSFRKFKSADSQWKQQHAYLLNLFCCTMNYCKVTGDPSRYDALCISYACTLFIDAM